MYLIHSMNASLYVFIVLRTYSFIYVIYLFVAQRIMKRYSMERVYRENRENICVVEM